GGGAVSVLAAAHRREHRAGTKARVARGGRRRARHGHDQRPGALAHRAALGAAGHPHRYPRRAGAEHRHGYRGGTDRWRRPRYIRVPGDRTDGDRSGAVGGDSDRGDGLLGGGVAGCAGRSAGSGQTMITVENLSKHYGATNAVDDVSMQIAGNSITVIVGTSGSGKSTLLRMINRLIEPSAGRVLIEGKDTRSEPAHLLRRRIGYAIQGHGLFPH